VFERRGVRKRFNVVHGTTMNDVAHADLRELARAGLGMSGTATIRAGTCHVAAGGGYAILVASAMPAGTASLFRAAPIVNPELPRRMVLSTTLLRPHTLATRAVSELIQELAPTAL
jgi:hypothetical protein